jgi:transcriptional/translational regulatory protein YebC/TACO1
VLSYPKGLDEDTLMEAALEAGAEDVISLDDGGIDVLVQPEQFEMVRDSLIGAGFSPESAEVTMRASTTIALDEEDAVKLLKLVDRLEDLDDVQNVYSNADISEDILAKLG